MIVSPFFVSVMKNKTVIKVNLSPAGCDDAIKQLRKYKRKLNERIYRLIDLMLENGEDYAINEVGHFDTGETVSSVVAYRKGKKGVIIAKGAAIWIEFGTGVHYNGAAGSSPHPKGAELGMTIGSYGQGYGRQDGWFYPTDDPRYEIKRRDENGNIVGTGYGYTHGIKANAFMYRTAKELERQIPELAKKVFKDD